MNLNPINWIEIEASSYCNAFCFHCLRQHSIDEEHKFHVSPIKYKNKNLNLNIIDNVYSSNNISDYVLTEFIGAIGDPFCNPNIVDIVEKILYYKPKSKITIHTNGGIGDISYFEHLGKILNKNTEHLLIFSIDGLNDTNHIYRRNVKWDNIIDRINTFISNGGRGCWKFIEFGWNSHQINDAKKYASELGMTMFSHEQPRKDLGDLPIKYELIKKTISVDEDEYEDIQINSDFKFIPECITDKKMFISPIGKIFPCCDIYSDYISPTLNNKNRQELVNFFDIESDWLDLNNKNIDDIFNNPQWKYIRDNMKNFNRCKLYCSIDGCGKMSNGSNQRPENDREIFENNYGEC